MLTSNEQYLVEQLATKEGYHSYKSLAEALGVSTRTIRNLLQNIEPFLAKNNLHIEQKYGIGIRMVQSIGRNRENRIIPLVDLSAIYRREVMKLLLLLNFRTKTSINKLAEQFYVTKNAIFLDLKRIEKELWIYNLTVVRDHEGTRIEGQRKLIKRAIIDIVHQYGISIMYENQKYISESLGVDSVVLSAEFEQLVRELLKETHDLYDYNFNFDFFQTLIIHLVVDIKLFGKESVESEKRKEFTRAGDYFQSRLEEILGILFSEGYNSNRFQEYCDAFSIVEIDALENKGTSILIENYEKISGIRLVERDLLKNELNRFLYQNGLRQEYRIAVFHPMLNAFLSNYGPQFVALKLSHQSNSEMISKMTDDEIAYELVYFLIHSRQYQRDFKIGVNMHSSAEFLTFLLQKLESEFPLSQFEKATISEEYDLEISVSSFWGKRGLEEGKSIDPNNLQQLEALRNQIEGRRAEKLIKCIETTFDYRKEMIATLPKKDKENVLELIKSSLNNNFSLSDSEWFDLVEEDKINPTFWSEKQSALLVLYMSEITKSVLIRFDLPAQIRWRNNNDLSRVNKIYLLISNQINVEESTVLYKVIQFDRIIQKNLKEN
ncbi:transcription antiterminator [Enterococcus sp. 2201sp1_2201st1_C11_2201SCRN_220225]|uniref:transcription antiterminator n=2 Tax=unclassified Enterococcus TaxID=2608891 RepID=UPI0034A28A2D